jgi:WD40 repeat protein
MESSQEAHAGPVLAWSSDARGEWAATGGRDGKVRFWNLKESRCSQTILASSRPILSVALLPEPGWIAILDAAGKLEVRSTRGRDQEPTFSAQLPAVRGDHAALGFLPGPILAVTWSDRALRFQDL